MKWGPINMHAPAPSAEQLRLKYEEAQALLEMEESERLEIESALSSLALEPERYVAAETRLQEIRSARPVRERAIELFEHEIGKADRREARDALLAQRETLQRRSNKLAKNLPERFDKAAHALAEILKEISDDAHEWEVLGLHLQEVGEAIGRTAEQISHERTGFVRNPSPFGNFSICGHSYVLGWDEKPLYRGRLVDLR